MTLQSTRRAPTPAPVQPPPTPAPTVRPLALPARRTWRTADSLGHKPPYTQGSLALSYPIARESGAAHPGAAQSGAAQSGAGDSSGHRTTRRPGPGGSGAAEPAAVDSAGPARTQTLVVVPHGSRGAGAAVDAWAATFIQAIIEVIASERPVTQLVRWTSRGVYQEITGRQRLVARRRGVTVSRPVRQHVATIRICRPTDGCAEVAARIVFGARSRAIAVRFDYQRGRWMCTDITFG